MRTPRQPGQEPVPGYRLIEPLGRGGFGEVWKCEAPGGLLKAIKFVHDAEDAGFSGAQRELQALQHIRSLRHPFLLSMDRIERDGADLVIVMELADKSLHDQMQECRAAGLPGISRGALVADLKEAAEALDVMNLRHELLHLDVKPRNLLLVDLHVKVADFGLVNTLAAASGGLDAVSPIYASPEVFQGKASPTSDQYSLAITYHELLTGVPPFVGKSFAQLAMLHTRQEPDLSRLSPADQVAVTRALDKSPTQRFASCTEFVNALIFQQGSGTVRRSRVMRALGKPVRTDPPRDEGAEATVQVQPAFGVGSDTSRIAAEARLRGTREAALPVSDYEFLTCLSRSDLLEVWSGKAGGKPCVIRFVCGLGGLDPEARRVALQQLETLEHPGLVPTTLVRCEPGRLVLAGPRVGQSLGERARQVAGPTGTAGMSRGELLGILRQAAEALDDLYTQHEVPHLGLSAEAILLASEGVLLGDFGLAALVWLPAGKPPAATNPRYAPPPHWPEALGRHADAYALALLYQELLTGKHPLSARRGEPAPPPDLTPLPETDRAVVARALDPVPGRRFDRCVELIEALEDAGHGEAASGSAPPTEETPGEAMLEEVLSVAADGWQWHEHAHFRYLARPGDCLQHRCIAPLPRWALPGVLEPFRQERHAELLDARENRFVYRVRMVGKGWGRLLRRPSGLEVEVYRIDRPELPEPMAEVQLWVRAYGGSDEQRATLLREAGPELLATVRKALNAHPDRRGQDRVGYVRAIEVYPVQADGDLGVPVVAWAQDICRSGMGLYLPSQPASGQLQIHLPRRDHTVPVPARVVRVVPRGTGFEVGIVFAS